MDSERDADDRGSDTGIVKPHDDSDDTGTASGILGMSLFTSQGFHSLDFVIVLPRGEMSTLTPVSHSVTQHYFPLHILLLLLYPNPLEVVRICLYYEPIPSEMSVCKSCSTHPTGWK